MVKLSKRLQHIASYIPVGASVVDVGTDHGLIPVYLIQNQLTKSVFACDIHPEPLQHARLLARETDTEGQIDFRVCDGLQGFSRADGIDHVVIAGMGGETMVHILSESDWVRKQAVLILQPQTKPAVLRRWLIENGYEIERESLIADAGRIYSVFMAKASEWPPDYTAAEFLLGRRDQIGDDPLLSRYMDTLLPGLLKAVPYDEDSRRLAGEIRQWREMLT